MYLLHVGLCQSISHGKLPLVFLSNSYTNVLLWWIFLEFTQISLKMLRCYSYQKFVDNESNFQFRNEKKLFEEEIRRMEKGISSVRWNRIQICE